MCEFVFYLQINTQGCGAQYVVWTAHSLSREDLRDQIPVIPLLFCVPPWGTSPDLIAFLPFTPNSIWMFLYSLGCVRTFLLVPSVFSVIIAPYVDVILMCSWGRWVQHPLALPPGSPLQDSGFKTHCVLSLTPVIVQEQFLPIYFLPFMDHVFLSFFCQVLCDVRY